MSKIQKIKESVLELMRKHLPEGIASRAVEMLLEMKAQELANAPKIAIIGKTGVGKSSTINALFDCELSYSHTEACTQNAEPVVLTNTNGKRVIIYDMPGLGEDEDKDIEHKKTYERILPECDVVLWVLDIADREMTFQQMMLREVLAYYTNRLVIAANKSDIVHPNDWISSVNLPSDEQQIHLEKRIDDIRKKLVKVVESMCEERIIYFSATKKYRLEELFASMMEACPKRRAWVLEDCVNLENWKTEVDPSYLEVLNK